MDENELREDNLLEWLKARMNDDEYSTIRAFLDDYMRGNREYREGSEARMAEYQTAADESAKTIQDLKARNYDLLMKVPAADDQANAGDGVVVEDVDEDGTVYHIDNLFTDADEEVSR